MSSLYNEINSQIEKARHFLFIFYVHERALEEVTSVFKRVFVTLATRALIGASGELVSGYRGALKIHTHSVFKARQIIIIYVFTLKSEIQNLI
jgi:hypothetical protein